MYLHFGGLGPVYLHRVGIRLHHLVVPSSPAGLRHDVLRDPLLDGAVHDLLLRDVALALLLQLLVS